MADVEVKLPPLGDDAPSEARLSFFYIEEGGVVSKGDDLCEMVTDKATFDVPLPCSGRVKNDLIQEGELVKVGQPLIVVDAGE